MSFSGMLFLMLLGLIIFQPKKLPHVGKQQSSHLPPTS